MSGFTTVYVTTRFSAMHLWPNASVGRYYLGSAHRHLFHAKLSITVRHDDREIEFHDLLEQLESFCRVYGSLEPEDVGSCEMIARQIAVHFDGLYPGRGVIADVSEDGENGAVVFVPASA